MAQKKSHVQNNKKDTHEEDGSLEKLRDQLIGGNSRKKVLDQVKMVAEYILKKEKVFSERNAISGKEIYEKYNEIRKELEELPEINSNSFAAYLSRVSNNPEFNIICPGRKKGYYWDKRFEPIKSGEKSSGKGDLEIVNEAKLYGLVKSWLLEKCEIAADISSNNGNKAWGNPDLVGFRFFDVLNKTSFEIVTVELKLTPDSWRRWIFEAVSHTRFANRSYFAFLYPENWKLKLDGEDMQLYAEHFHVGILVLGTSEDLYQRVKEGKPISNNDFSESEINFIEYYQAPYTPSHPKFINDFLKNLKIENYRDLHQFSESIME